MSNTNFSLLCSSSASRVSRLCCVACTWSKSRRGNLSTASYASKARKWPSTQCHAYAGGDQP